MLQILAIAFIGYLGMMLGWSKGYAYGKQEGYTRARSIMGAKVER